MDFPAMGLCPDRKRGLNSFFMFGKSKNPNVNKVSTMFHNNGVMFETQSDCQNLSLTRSKSQVRSSINQDQCVWDFIKFAENLYKTSSDFISLSKDHFSSSSVPSPPKKKFAKEEYLESNEEDFPLVDKTKDCARVTATDCPKQSYAEVAKTVCSRPVGASGSNQSSSLNKERSDNPDSHQRRQQSLHRKSNYRKHNRRDKRRYPCHYTYKGESEATSISIKNDNSSLCLPVLAQSSGSQESQVWNNSGSQTNSKHSSRKSSPISESKKQFTRANRNQKHPSHISRKRPAKTRKYDCDIELVNWRTGEPINPKMPVDSLSERCRTDTSMVVDEEHIPICDERDHASSKQNDHVTDTSCSEQQSSQTWNRRRSLSSECSLDSEDSFIVFQSGGPSDSISDISGDWSDFDSDDSFDDDSDSLMEPDECDECSLSPSQRLQEINLRWKNDIEALEVSESVNQQTCSRDFENKRKVHFTSSKPQVHWMLTWDYAYRSSRVGPWEEMARDRARFHSRIQQFENILSPVLNPDHRAKIWENLHT